MSMCVSTDPCDGTMGPALLYRTSLSDTFDWKSPTKTMARSTGTIPWSVCKKHGHRDYFNLIVYDEVTKMDDQGLLFANRPRSKRKQWNFAVNVDTKWSSSNREGVTRDFRIMDNDKNLIHCIRIEPRCVPKHLT